MTDRTLTTLVLSVLVGVGAAFIYTLHTPESLHYQVKPTAPPTLPDIPPAPPASKPQSRERLKNKMLTQARIHREIGEPPRVRFYRDRPRNLPDREFHCLALNVYHEARGESVASMIAVAQVTLNRLDVHYRGQGTLCRVVYDAHQFSWTRSITKRRETPTGASWSTASLAAQKAVEGVRIAGLENALHYHADWIPHPRWSLKMFLNHVIGQHIYLKEFPS